MRECLCNAKARTVKKIKKLSACLALNIQGMNPGLRSRSSSKLFFLKEDISCLNKENIFVPFIAIGETWLKPFVADAQLHIEGYNIYRSDRKLSRCGGALLYIHKDIVIDTFSEFDDDTCNGVACLSKSSNCVLICVYRPPSSSVFSFSSLIDFLDNFIVQNNSSGKFSIYISGDFNFPTLNWMDLTSSQHNSTFFSLLFQFLDKHLLVQYVSESTRNHNLLDLFFTDNQNFVECIKIDKINYSDHNLIKIYNTYFSPLQKGTASVNKNETLPNFSKLNLRQTNFSAVNKELSVVNWDEVTNVAINDFPNSFRTVVYNILLKYSGLKHTGKAKSKCRFSKHINTLNKKIFKLKKKLKFSNCSTTNKVKFFNKIQSFHEKKKQVLFDKALHFENKAINKIKTDSKFFFKYAKSFRVTPSPPNILIDENENSITDPQKIVDMLQDQFKSVFSVPLDASKLGNCLNFQVSSFNPIQSSKITNELIVNAIDEMRPNSSCSHHDIPAIIFKRCKFSLCVPLRIFFNKSIEQGKIPLEYKKQTVIPLYKKGPKTLPENFRLISLTSHTVKILERVLRNFFIEHLENNKLINLNQHGFRQNRSCCTQLVSHINYILSSSIQGNEVDCVYLDFAKAFDKMDHGLLLRKLELYGITGKYLEWVKNFLEDRTQVVFLNNFYSYSTTVQSGVPQGSVLGPLLFLIFINDLPQSVHNSNLHILSFADDTKISSKISNVNDKSTLQCCLNNLLNWSISNNMELNSKKFEFIAHKLFPDSPNQKALKELPFYHDFFTYIVSDNLIVYPSEYVRDLGVYIDGNLNWNFHYNQIIKKAKQICAWVLHTFYSRKKEVLLMLFKSLIRPKLEYCCEVWNPFLI